jgi:hypothetical protein
VHWEVGRFRAPEDAIDVACRLPEYVNQGDFVGVVHQAADLGEITGTYTAAMGWPTRGNGESSSQSFTLRNQSARVS